MTLGMQGEEQAVKFLRRQGYKIITQNYRNNFGEIDIIASDKGTIVFIEVKARMTGAYGMPFESVHPRKQEKIKKVALMYLKKFRKAVPARFDVVSIVKNKENTRFQLIKDAFEL